MRGVLYLQQHCNCSESWTVITSFYTFSYAGRRNSIFPQCDHMFLRALTLPGKGETNFLSLFQKTQGECSERHRFSIIFWSLCVFLQIRKHTCPRFLVFLREGGEIQKRMFRVRHATRFDMPLERLRSFIACCYSTFSDKIADKKIYLSPGHFQFTLGRHQQEGWTGLLECRPPLLLHHHWHCPFQSSWQS